MYSPTSKINLSLSWVYATGNAVTLPTSTYPSQLISSYLNQTQVPLEDIVDERIYTNYIEDYGEKNNIRMKPFHHLDVAVQFIHPHKKNNGQSIFEVSIYNVYNHRNPFFYYVGSSYDYEKQTSKQVIYQFSIFP